MGAQQAPGAQVRSALIAQQRPTLAGSPSTASLGISSENWERSWAWRAEITPSSIGLTSPTRSTSVQRPPIWTSTPSVLTETDEPVAILVRSSAHHWSAECVPAWTEALTVANGATPLGLADPLSAVADAMQRVVTAPTAHPKAPGDQVAVAARVDVVAEDVLDISDPVVWSPVAGGGLPQPVDRAQGRQRCSRFRAVVQPATPCAQPSDAPALHGGLAHHPHPIQIIARHRASMPTLDARTPNERSTAVRADSAEAQTFADTLPASGRES